ncbi:MAG: hypothetical protein AVDCRST_MAG95-3606 [uncultured Adhaeribacter sp.]|uniref:Uncharacterized protein n=1 Tax=uncultured Adhaeribacter sp. TaxID=448109 RepID=A0A6J4JR80_9BACT|nr:MAG: hypothetical protein AVDCRST_MAG95-3606 [uncultured Adhaeribacter sp.]
MTRTPDLLLISPECKNHPFFARIYLSRYFFAKQPYWYFLRAFACCPGDTDNESGSVVISRFFLLG